MKFQLLTTILIASIAGNTIAATNKQNSIGYNPSYQNYGVDNFGSSDQYNSENYENSQLDQEDSLEEQNLEYQNDLADLFTQLEGLNSLLEEGGDNFDAWGSMKSAAKGVYKGAKKVANSPAGKVALGVARILL